MNNKIIRGWKIIEEIGKGSLGTVYKAVKDDGSVCAIKHVGLPRSVEEVDSLILNGLIKDKTEANKYFANVIRKEIETVKKFAGNQYIINFCDIYQENRLDGSGIDFYIRMEYAEDITRYFKNRKISIDDVVKIGIDICSALELCSSINITHNDIKPSNVFIGADGNYKLGDFSAMTNIGSRDVAKFGTFNYLSPEVYTRKETSLSTDLYSLGLLMYKLLNGELPFKTKDNDEKLAFSIRMTGTEIPIIEDVDKDLMDILVKACSFNVNERYQNATEMKIALEKVLHSSSNKKNVDFILDEFEDTIGIYEMNELLENNNSDFNLVSKIKNAFCNRRKFNKLIVTLVFSGIILFIISGCILGRNCSEGHVNKNGICVKGYYYCKDGYVLNKNNKCQKTLESIDAKVTYTCKKDYTLNGDVCVSNDIKTPDFVYQCADGFTLNGTKCEREESVDAAFIYTCPSGYVTAGDKCVTVSNIDATKSGYTCDDSSYTLSGSICKKNTTKITQANVSYNCNLGGTLNGTKCTYTSSATWHGWMPSCSQGTYSYLTKKCEYTLDANKVYNCSQGTSDENGNCVYTTTITKSAIAKYSCPSGYTAVGNQCAKATDKAAIKKYTCTDGAVLKGTKCYTTISTDAVGMYSCPDGYITSGMACYKNDFPSARKKFTCSRIYTLNNGKCEKYDIVSARVYYEND